MSTTASTTSGSTSNNNNLLFLDSLCRQIEDDDPGLAAEGLSLNSLWNVSAEDWNCILEALSKNTTLSKLEFTLRGTREDDDDLLSSLLLNPNCNLKHLIVNFFAQPAPNLNGIVHVIRQQHLTRKDGEDSSTLRHLELSWLAEADETQDNYDCVLTPYHVEHLAGLEQLTLRGMRIEAPYNEYDYSDDDDNKVSLSWREVSLDGCFVNGGVAPETMLWWFPQAMDRLQILRLNRCCTESMTPILAQLEHDFLQNELVVLDLAECQLSPQDSYMLARALDASPHLLELNLADNPNIDLRIVCQNTINHSLQRLDVSNCQVVEQDLQELMDTFPFLQAINLTCNPIRAFDQAMPTLRKLEEVVLEQMTNGLDDESLAQWLQRAPPKRLNLSGNVVCQQTLRALGGCSIIILAGCQLGDEGLETLLESSGSTTWKELYIPYNNITNQGMRCLSRAFSKLSQLTTLSMEYNNFDTGGLEELLRPSFHNTCCRLPHSLQDLTCWNHQLSSAAVFEDLEARLNHYLQLNRAGKSLLYQDDKIKASLWPAVFYEADRVYGPNAVFDFLQTRPDILSSSHGQQYY